MDPTTPNRGRWPGLALAALEEAGYRSGAARRSVVELLAREDCCLSAQEIAARLRARDERVGTASVYRALDLLQRTGLVQRVELGGAAARFEAVTPGAEHHHHVVCERCGELTPFEDRGLERAIAGLQNTLGHRVSGHDVLIRGECPDCAAPAG